MCIFAISTLNHCIWYIVYSGYVTSAINEQTKIRWGFVVLLLTFLLLFGAISKKWEKVDFYGKELDLFWRDGRIIQKWKYSRLHNDHCHKTTENQIKKNGKNIWIRVLEIHAIPSSSVRTKLSHRFHGGEAYQLIHRFIRKQVPTIQATFFFITPWFVMRRHLFFLWTIALSVPLFILHILHILSIVAFACKFNQALLNMDHILDGIWLS